MGDAESMCCMKSGEGQVVGRSNASMLEWQEDLSCHHCGTADSSLPLQPMRLSSIDGLRKDQVNPWTASPLHRQQDDLGIPVCTQSCHHERLQVPSSYIADTQDDGQIILMQRGNLIAAMFMEEFEEDQVEADVTDAIPKPVLPVRGDT
eukprot:TRINITY_DN43308_c0_g1_i1.p1 TRINITY_DN43308_c0_g1~~TRINITY_DN43308_c0_g1_i1.p1  ORF type:complete len:164 (+),score=30.34 TRINITY_DN43308_c0_g1_i1:46-492(+)